MQQFFMDSYHRAVLVILSSVAFTGAVLLAGIHAAPQLTGAVQSGPTEKGYSASGTYRWHGDHCVINANCQPSGIECCNEKECLCSPFKSTFGSPEQYRRGNRATGAATEGITFG